MATNEPISVELRRSEEGLLLVGGGMVLRADFTHMLPRLAPGKLQHELLVRAARVKGVGAPCAIDATAGLGEDSLLLAAAGFEVLLFERNATIAALLRDGLARAAGVPELAPVVSRMHVVEGDSIEALRAIAASINGGAASDAAAGGMDSDAAVGGANVGADSNAAADGVDNDVGSNAATDGTDTGSSANTEAHTIGAAPSSIHTSSNLDATSDIDGAPGACTLNALDAFTPPDVVYLDPMFPERTKSAAVGKKFQLLHALAAPCTNEDELLAAALAAHPRKVVIKRPAKGPNLGGIKPSYTIAGKAVRYDCIAIARKR